jgi:hypothetical protein
MAEPNCSNATGYRFILDDNPVTRLFLRGRVVEEDGSWESRTTRLDQSYIFYFGFE